MLIEQSEGLYEFYRSPGMDMSLMSSFMGMPGMNMGVNPLVQLLNQNGLHPNWPAGLTSTYSTDFERAAATSTYLQGTVLKL